MDSGLEGNTKEGEIYRRYKNELDSDELSDEEALRAYKEQQYAERGFLKDPFFFADSIIEERIADCCDGDDNGARTHGLQYCGAQVA